jgi:hypothetical protein
MNENYGSLTHGYHPTSRTNSMSQEWEETVPLSPSAAIGQPAEIDESGELVKTRKIPTHTLYSNFQQVVLYSKIIVKY